MSTSIRIALGLLLGLVAGQALAQQMVLDIADHLPPEARARLIERGSLEIILALMESHSIIARMIR